LTRLAGPKADPNKLYIQIRDGEDQKNRVA
jgi:hypothetical protein